MPFS
ncbi:hypothetical protein D018_0719A, partial [Vibrio parahaemolyticus VP2007-007]|jgi:hypothetical protein